jgi:AcrR family transcriptional regulator
MSSPDRDVDAGTVRYGPKIGPMEPSATAIPPHPVHEHRRRLLQAMGAVAEAKGFVAATIADIVREAGVSKRTFYEHFASKEDCFLALYLAVSGAALRTLKEAVAPGRPWQRQLEQAMGAYLSHLSLNPGLLKTLFVDIHHLGVPGHEARREVMRQLADFMTETVRANGSAPGAPGMDPALAMAAVGGINELVLQHVEQGRAEDLMALTASASEVVLRLTRATE